MKVTFDLDEKQIPLLEKLRGGKSPDSFAAHCFTLGLNFLDAQYQKSLEAAKHPLLAFPEADSKFQSLDEAAVRSALDKRDPADPVAVEITRLVNVFLGQLREYAKQDKRAIKSRIPITPPPTAIGKAALRLALSAANGAAKSAKGEKK
jgi:hypothetical protein